MNIIDILHGEHRMLLKLFDYADDQMAAKRNMEVVSEALKMVFRLLLIHARQEEDVLFDALVPKLGNIGPKAVSIHRDMHREIENRFGVAMAGSSPSIPDCRKAIMMCREHFKGEEAQLFPLALRILSQDDLDVLALKLIKVVNKSSGGGV